ncbi:hypothetical protein FNV43_RR22415 [Rhamnella rubrinervis]|uniref:Uncharacterized protein n=1 Tax=Rhamnella rubrinervis TaxID=2594499 RepID=A0A8K0GSH4_9ROSA|nr:hypothetical protein FNV43_RR22415 [Rhamnella rubrinervis]
MAYKLFNKDSTMFGRRNWGMGRGKEGVDYIYPSYYLFREDELGDIDVEQQHFIYEGGGGGVGAGAGVLGVGAVAAQALKQPMHETRSCCRSDAHPVKQVKAS